MRAFSSGTHTELPVRSTRARLVSFDGQTTATTGHTRPDRYRDLERDLGDAPRIARGGGYSYVAASFGPDVVVQDLRDFDRVLGIDVERSRCTVESGISLRALYGTLGARRLWLPIQPGYPDVTVGGCIAANVNAKNSRHSGTFGRRVDRLTLFHPDHGRLEVDHERGADLFELTCGGLGLTGTILAATLRVDPLAAGTVRVRRRATASLVEALRELDSTAAPDVFAYSWHDPTTSGGRFGRGIVYQARHTDPSEDPVDAAPRYPRITAERRAMLPFGLWNRVTIATANEVLWRLERAALGERIESLFSFLFPFARNPYYFLLFGARGFLETQMLVPLAAAEGFVRELERQAMKCRPPITLLSLKLLSGEQRLLRFEGEGLCISIDLVRSPEAIFFLEILDQMVLAAAGIPNVMKDSRLSREIVQRAYPEYERFRDELRRFDPRRLFRSHLSTRLGL